MRAILMAAGVSAATAAMANPQLAASNRYVCGDGSLAVIEILASGPVLDWRGRRVRLSAGAAFSGFRFSGEGLSLTGGGEAGYRTLQISGSGMPPLDCKSVPPQAMAGIATGTATYRQRITLVPGATVTVELRDVSRADAPAPLLARTVLKPRGNQVPLWWRLDFDAAKVRPPAQPGLSARVNDAKGNLIWISDTFTPLPVTATQQHAEAEIVLVPVRAAPSPSSK